MNSIADKTHQAITIECSDPSIKATDNKKSTNVLLQKRLVRLNSKPKKTQSKRIKRNKCTHTTKHSHRKIDQKNNHPRKTSNRYFEGMLIGSFFGAALTTVVSRLLTET